MKTDQLHYSLGIWFPDLSPSQLLRTWPQISMSLACITPRRPVICSPYDSYNNRLGTPHRQISIQLCQSDKFLIRCSVPCSPPKSESPTRECYNGDWFLWLYRRIKASDNNPLSRWHPRVTPGVIRCNPRRPVIPLSGRKQLLFSDALGANIQCFGILVAELLILIHWASSIESRALGFQLPARLAIKNPIEVVIC